MCKSVFICTYIYIYIWNYTAITKEPIFHWSLDIWMEAKLIIDTVVDWQIQQNYFNTAKNKAMSLEINCEDNIHMIRESWKAVAQEKKKIKRNHHWFLTDLSG